MVNVHSFWYVYHSCLLQQFPKTLEASILLGFQNPWHPSMAEADLICKAQVAQISHIQLPWKSTWAWAWRRFVDSHPFIYNNHMYIFIYMYMYIHIPHDHGEQITATKWYVHYSLYHNRTTRLQWNNGIQNCSWISPQESYYIPTRMILSIYFTSIDYQQKMASIPFCSTVNFSHTSVADMALI